MTDRKIDVSKENTYCPEGYPYIGKSRFSDTIIMFTAPNTGICLSATGKYHDGSPSGNRCGDYLHNYTEDSFERYEGEIVIKN